MAVADRIAKLVGRRNKKLAEEAQLDVAMGLFWLTVIYGMLLALSWMWFMRARFASPGQWSLGFTIGTATCCALLAWRQVDPLRGIAPMTNTQKALTFISHASPHMLYFSPLHAAGGLVELLTSGFRPLFDGIGQFLNLLSTAEDVQSQAADMLAKAERGRFAMQSIKSPEPLLLLRQLKLVRVELRGVTELLLPTERGEALLSRTRPRGVTVGTLPGAYI